MSEGRVIGLVLLKGWTRTARCDNPRVSILHTRLPTILSVYAFASTSRRALHLSLWSSTLCTRLATTRKKLIDTIRLDAMDACARRMRLLDALSSSCWRQYYKPASITPITCRDLVAIVGPVFLLGNTTRTGYSDTARSGRRICSMWICSLARIITLIYFGSGLLRCLHRRPISQKRKHSWPRCHPCAQPCTLVSYDFFHFHLNSFANSKPDLTPPSA